MKIIDTYVQEGDLVEVPGEEEAYYYPVLLVMVRLVTGAIMAHDLVLRPTSKWVSDEHCDYMSLDDKRDTAARLVARIKAAGEINLEHWSEYNPPSYSNGEVPEWELMDDEERSRRGF